MTPLERGYLMLCCALADPDVKPLTLPQLETLRRRVLEAPPPDRPNKDLTVADLMAWGYDVKTARQIVFLMEREEILDRYLRIARLNRVEIMTCISAGYPHDRFESLGAKAPAVMFYRGDPSLLQKACIGVVGSRLLRAENGAFAKEIGRKIAEEGYVLVSGHAHGADRAAEEACLDAGGSVISFVPDNLMAYEDSDRHLFVSMDGFHYEFSAARALYRNHLIHALAEKTFVAQCNFRGGTWQGVSANLQHGYSEVYVFDDGSEVVRQLTEMGAIPIERVPQHLGTLRGFQTKLF